MGRRKQEPTNLTKGQVKIMRRMDEVICGLYLLGLTIEDPQPIDDYAKGIPVSKLDKQIKSDFALASGMTLMDLKKTVTVLSNAKKKLYKKWEKQNGN